MADYDDDLVELDEEQDEDEEDGPGSVFVSMAFGRDHCDDVWAVIEEVCREHDMIANRVHQTQVAGSPNIDEAIQFYLDRCDMVIVDLTHERPCVAHEIGLCDAEFDRSLILLIARQGTPRFGNIQSRMVNYYADEHELRTILETQLPLMIDAWCELQESDEDEDEDEDEDDDGEAR